MDAESRARLVAAVRARFEWNGTHWSDFDCFLIEDDEAMYALANAKARHLLDVFAQEAVTAIFPLLAD